MVWLPDNSAADLTAARDAFGAAITAACGRPAKLMTTTDYNVAIEAIASGNAQMALLGAEGYVQAAFTNSDGKGGIDGACYYSRICVRKEDADAYSIANVKGVSRSSAPRPPRASRLPFRRSCPNSAWTAPTSRPSLAASSVRFCSATAKRARA